MDIILSNYLTFTPSKQIYTHDTKQNVKLLCVTAVIFDK